MIARSHRFHGLNSLRLVYMRGRIIRGPIFAVKFLPGRQSGKPAGAGSESDGTAVPYRAAVVVSRKVHKSAVVRNRIRRRMYELIRSFEPDMSGPYDLVFTVFDERAAGVPSAELKAQLQNQLAKGGIIGSNVESDRGGYGIVDGMEREA
jgi:ribonuclease P protein component